MEASRFIRLNRPKKLGADVLSELCFALCPNFFFGDQVKANCHLRIAILENVAGLAKRFKRVDADGYQAGRIRKAFELNLQQTVS